MNTKLLIINNLRIQYNYFKYLKIKSFIKIFSNILINLTNKKKI